MMDKSANCRALKVLCAASSPGRLDEIRRAAVGVEWELVGGASSLEELVDQLAEVRPNVVVIDSGLGPEAAARARQVLPRARIVSIGELPGVDAVAPSVDDVRSAILGGRDTGDLARA
jgi:DNA-binding NarL/FixJ family response regulator